MKNLVIFFCDINGTIDGIKKNSRIDYQEFNILLKKLKEKDEADILLFSLVSSEKKDIVFKYSNTLHSHLDNKITMGKQFYDIGYLEENKPNPSIIGKVWQILSYLDELKKTYQIKKIYLADDTEMNLNLVLELLEHENQEKFESIIPIYRDGLCEVNDIILAKFFVTTKMKTIQKNKV